MKPAAEHTRSEGGFSMLSVLVAIVLLSVGVMALSSTGVYVLGIETEASTRGTAVSIAVAYMEDVKTRDLSTLVSESPVTLDEAGVEDLNGRFTRTLIVGPAAGVDDVEQVTVRVQYPAGRGRTGTIALQTVVYSGNQ